MNLLQRYGMLVYVAIFAAIAFLNRIVGFITDFAWFNELGLTSVFKVSFFSAWALGLLGGAVFAMASYISRRLAQANCRKGMIVPIGEEDDLIGTLLLQPWRHHSRQILAVTGLIGALFGGVWTAGHWETVQKGLHGVSFGLKDPIFQHDVGFYIFTLPFYSAICKYFLGLTAFSGLVALATYVFEGAVYVTRRGIQWHLPAKRHLLFMGGFLCLFVGAYFQLKGFSLLAIQRPVAPGPGYAELHAYLPILRILPFIAVLSALACWASLFVNSGRLAAGSLGLFVIGVVVAGGYREFVQRFSVASNEIVKETPYIRHAIDYTRKAYGLDAVQELEFDPKENLTTDALRRNDLTIKNIRLWDHGPLLTTYAQLQEIRTYYEFMDVDNDRYMVDGELRQVMLSPRELNPMSLPSRIWINEHLTYTHGYGLTLGPVNRISPEGLPEFFIKDIPPQVKSAFSVSRPEIYFGEARGSFVIVNSKAKEFDYPSGDENIYSNYGGSGGVPIDSLWSRLLFALRFKELKLLLSSDFTPQSRILYHRNIQERLSKAMPFLRYDQDPYLVISKDGKLYWIVDAYTQADGFPYSVRLRGIGNYIRNSVKVVVDAYHGSATFYIADESDPLIQTYSRIFPGVFKPIIEMSEDLRSHLRYPQDLFSIQAYMYSTYHMTDPQVFYNKEDLWKIPEKPVSGSRSQPMAPYYTIMKLASVGEKEEFILMVPFTPARKENMIAWMAARCDAPNAGKLLVYNFPKQKLVYGPQQIESRIDQDPVISQQLTLWNQGGSKVIRGSLLVIPVDSSLLYVQPLYLEATGGGLPELKRVIVVYGNTIAMEETLESSLSRIFRGRLAKGEGAPQRLSGDLKGLIRQAQTHFDRANSHMKQGDWSGYGQEMREVEQLLKKMGEAP